MNPIPLLSIRDFAELTELTPRKVRYLIEKGDLPLFKYKHRWYVELRHVETIKEIYGRK